MPALARLSVEKAEGLSAHEVSEMTGTGTRNRLRLARIAGDSVLNEKLLPKERLTGDLVGVIAVQMRSIVGEMESEWESNPASDELREGFGLLRRYLDCLKTYPKGSV